MITNNTIKRTVVAFFIILIISFGVAPSYQPESARAFSILGISGVVEIVIDPAHILTTINSWLQNFFNRITDIAFKAILANMKKRVLDSLLDETTAWIRGDADGTPKFVTQPGKFLKDSADAAIGDVLNQIGLSELCRNIPSIPRLAIQIGLAKPSFSQKVECTLSQVINNLEAFANNFEVGGTIAYQELLKPQNNPWGMNILIRDELDRKRGEKIETVKQEATLSAGTGSLGIKECVEWHLVIKETKQLVPAGGSLVLIEENPLLLGSPWFISRMPSQPPPLDEPDPHKNGGVHINRLDTSKVEWRCAKDRTTTPGTIISEGIKSTTNDDKNYILNSEDIATILGALLDAAIYRVIKEGAKGFAAMTLSQTTTGSPQPARNLNNLPQSVQDAAATAQQAQQNLLENSRQPFLQHINEASSTLAEASNFALTASSSLNASTTNFNTAGLIQVLQVIVTRGSPSCSSTAVAWAQQELNIASTISRPAITNLFDRINNLSQRLAQAASNIQGMGASQVGNLDISTLTNMKDEAIQLHFEAREASRNIGNKLTEARQQFLDNCSPTTFP